MIEELGGCTPAHSTESFSVSSSRRCCCSSSQPALANTAKPTSSHGGELPKLRPDAVLAAAAGLIGIDAGDGRCSGTDCNCGLARSCSPSGGGVGLVGGAEVAVMAVAASGTGRWQLCYIMLHAPAWLCRVGDNAAFKSGTGDG